MPVTVCPVWVGLYVMVGASLKKLRRTKASTAHTTGVRGSGVLGGGDRKGVSRFVTTLFRNPTTPTTGDTAGGATGAAASKVLTVFALRAALAEKVCAAGAANVATVPNVFGR